MTSALRSALLLALLCSTAAAESPRPTIGPRGVFYRPTDADHGVWAPGVQAKLPLAPTYALEGSVDAAPYLAYGRPVRTTVVQATLIGYFSSAVEAQAETLPYLLLGGGWYLGHTGSHRRFGLHVGAGVELMRRGPWTLDASYRFLWTQVFSWKKAPYWLGHDHAARGTMWTAALTRRF